MGMAEESETGDQQPYRQVLHTVSLHTEGLFILMAAFALVLIVPASLLMPQVPNWLPPVGLLLWLVWFISWASKGGIPPRVA